MKFWDYRAESTWWPLEGPLHHHSMDTLGPRGTPWSAETGWPTIPVRFWDGLWLIFPGRNGTAWFEFQQSTRESKKKENWQSTLELFRPRPKSEKQRMPTAKVPRSKRKAMIATCRCVRPILYHMENKETHWRQWGWLESCCRRLLRKVHRIERVCTLHAW